MGTSLLNTMQASSKIMEQVKVANQREDKKLHRELTEIKQIEKARRYEIRGEQLSLRREITINKLSNMKKSLRNSISEISDQNKTEENETQKSPDAQHIAAQHYGLSPTGAIGLMKRDSNARAKIRKPLPSISASMNESAKYLNATIAAVAADELHDDFPKEIFVYYPFDSSPSRADVESTIKKLLPSGVLKLPDLMPSVETIREYLAKKQNAVKRWGHQSREDRLLRWQSYCTACSSNGSSRQEDHNKTIAIVNTKNILPPISIQSELGTVERDDVEGKNHDINIAEGTSQAPQLETDYVNETPHANLDLEDDDEEDHANNSDEERSRDEEKQLQPTVPARKSIAGQLPAYVQLLGRLKSNVIDQYTDGSMHLEVRRQEQIQRERMGVPPGHLPVRRRHTVAVDVLSGATKAGAGSKQSVSVPPRNAAPVRIYISREMRSDKKLEESRKQVEHISRVKRAVELSTLRQAIGRTASFLGRQPLSVRLMPQQALSVEEMQMLGRLRQQKQIAMSTPGVKKNRRRRGLAVRFRHSAPDDLSALNEIQEYYNDEDADDNVFLSSEKLE